MRPEESPRALTHGTWQPDPRGILRWVAEPGPKLVTDGGNIACPQCRARVDQSCRTINGKRSRAHSARLVPQRCSCGVDLPRGHKGICGGCVTRPERRVGVAGRVAA